MFCLVMQTSLCVTLVFITCVTAISWLDLAKFSNISTSNTCIMTESCNNTCKITDSTNGGYNTPLLNPTLKECRPGNASDIPGVAKSINGNIIFDDQNCTHTTNTFNGNSWTISFWVKYNGYTSRTLIEVRNRSNNATQVSIKTNSYRVGVNTSGITTQNNVWTFIVLRMTVAKAVYLDVNGNKKFVGVVPGIENDTWILFGPQNTSADVVQIVDARIYSHCLTGREVTKLFNATLAPILVLQNDCLCPRNAPTLLPDPLSYGIFCRDHNNTSFYRVNAAEFAGDGDVNTYWNSSTSSTNITLDLKNVFQLSSIEIHFSPETSPSELAVTLTNKGNVSRIYKCRCTFPSSCKLNGENFTYNMMNDTDMKNKTSYNTLLADKVDIHLSGNCSNKTFYYIREIKITGSCHCSGDSGICMTPNGTVRTYNCSCTNVSHTTGQNCETCSNGFWRNSTYDLDCQNSCNCNTTGSINNSCNEDTGNCYCKSNVQGQQCDACVHNSYNLSNNGCTLCKCNSSGITECNSTGQCVCKPNVEETSGTCNSCKTNHYGFPSRCTECGCNAIGSQNQSCNEPSGQCYCKSYVMGRTCNECKEGFWNFHETNANGCEDCQCNVVVGSSNNTCDKISGQCQCRDDVVTNRKCDPEIAVTNITPAYGPMAGGTKVTLYGKQLGNREVNDIVVFLKDIQAKIIDRTPTTIIFETMNAAVGSADIKIKWRKKENGNQPIKEYTFPTTLNIDYRENSVIQETMSKLQSISSGGCNVELRGSALDSVYRPEIILYGIGEAPNITGTCSHNSGGILILCKPPNVSAWITNGTYSYGVILDGITDFLNMTTSVIEIQPDPTLYTSGEIVYRNVYDKLITVRGEGFRRACDKRDFRVHLSKRGECEIKELTDTEITFDPKETFPGTGEKETLKIYIGHLEKDVGIVEFRTFWKLQEFIYICVGIVGFILIVVITIIACCIRCRRYKNENKPEVAHRLEIVKSIFKRERKKQQESSKDTSEKRKEQDIVEQNETEHYCQLSFIEKEHPYVGEASPVTLQSMQDLNKSYSELFMDRLPQNVAELLSTSVIDESHIEPGNVYTMEGMFTRIVKGKYVSRSSTPYAGDCNTIKTLVQNYPAEGEIPKWLSLGLQECTSLRDVVHEKVLRLRGIAIDAKRIYVVYPAMKRNLKEFIKKTYGTQVINIEAVIRHCLDVGEGMMELHRRGIIHKDLAARNCMVDSAKVVKVADAAFASDLYPKEYVKQENRDLPVRWMAVESLQHISYYDKATDVWSYGVLLWEIFTGCSYLPYNELPDNDIYASVVMRGYRLRKPENIPEPYLDMFVRCMNTDSKLRPTFEEIMFFMNDVTVKSLQSDKDTYMTILQ